MEIIKAASLILNPFRTWTLRTEALSASKTLPFSQTERALSLSQWLMLTRPHLSLKFKLIKRVRSKLNLALRIAFWASHTHAFVEGLRTLIVGFCLREMTVTTKTAARRDRKTFTWALPWEVNCLRQHKSQPPEQHQLTSVRWFWVSVFDPRSAVNFKTVDLLRDDCPILTDNRPKPT